eukprot:TRINITY_DN10170_c0_g1_i4.p1 TRINITY_DN10170_c0_g1~~TRINITY_DN10170_c0_g1_i4.p1  ORF type:complete len:877 (+),score=106.51 TRINITY_DN10170_c0_g1_i4:1-2631(+)
MATEESSAAAVSAEIKSLSRVLDTQAHILKPSRRLYRSKQARPSHNRSTASPNQLAVATTRRFVEALERHRSAEIELSPGEKHMLLHANRHLNEPWHGAARLQSLYHLNALPQTRVGLVKPASSITAQEPNFTTVPSIDASPMHFEIKHDAAQPEETSPLLNLRTSRRTSPKKSSRRCRKKKPMHIHQLVLPLPELVVQPGHIHQLLDSLVFKEWLVETHMPERRVKQLLQNAEKFCCAYGFSGVLLSRDKVIAMARTQLQLRPEMVLLYMDQPQRYEKLVTKARRFQGENGHVEAVLVLQRQFRIVLRRFALQRQREQRAAVAIISATWAIRIRARALRRQALAQVSLLWKANSIRVQKLLACWDDFTSKPHVVVLLLSMHFSKTLRHLFCDAVFEQSQYVAEMVAILRQYPDAEVMLVVPEPWSTDMHEHFVSMVSQVCGITANRARTRFRVILPEFADVFALHRLPTAQLLHYSASSIADMINRIEGRPAYISSIRPGEYDIKLAAELNVPLLWNVEPECALADNRRSILEWLVDNQVPVAPHCFCSSDQPLRLAADFVLQHIDCNNFMIKRLEPSLDLGIACCDIASNLQCRAQVLEQRQLHGARWRRGSRLQQPLVRQIVAELKDVLQQHCILCHPYRAFDEEVKADFVRAIFREGFILEAAVPFEEDSDRSMLHIESSTMLHNGEVYNQHICQLHPQQIPKGHLHFSSLLNSSIGRLVVSKTAQVVDLLRMSTITGPITIRFKVNLTTGHWLVTDLSFQPSPQSSLSAFGYPAFAGTLRLSDPNLQPFKFSSLCTILKALCTTARSFDTMDAMLPLRSRAAHELGAFALGYSDEETMAAYRQVLEMLQSQIVSSPVDICGLHHMLATLPY